MIARSHARVFAVLAVLCAGSAYVGPSAAFDSMGLSRSATVSVVSDANGYNSLTSGVAWTCVGSLVVPTTTQCSVGTVTNKGAAGQAYRIMKETDTGPKVADWALGGVTAVSSTSSPWTAWTSEKAVGGSATIILNVSACVCSGQKYYANLTVEGQKANTLDFNETRVMVIISY